MNRTEFEALGDLHKSFEMTFTRTRLTPGLPIVARLDGRAFHTFTRGLERPYDAAFAKCMEDVVCYLVEQTNAHVGYRQSDEITLAWHNQPQDGVEAPMLFDGRVHKLLSILAAMASVKFHESLLKHLPAHADKLPVFDARVYQYPGLGLASQSFLWRESDAVRNSLTMLACAHFSQSKLHKANDEQKVQMLASIGVTWDTQPEVFRRGVYVKRVQVMKELTAQELSSIPEQHRPKGPVQRTVVQAISLPRVEDVQNLDQVLFYGAKPVVSGEPRLSWCGQCGEGYVGFCRGKTSDCPKEKVTQAA